MANAALYSLVRVLTSIVPSEKAFAVCLAACLLFNCTDRLLLLLLLLLNSLHPADCAPGLAMDANRNCQPCTLGKFCLGGDTTVNPNNTESACPDGLATIFAGAKSQAQCFTKPGYGRVAVQASNGKVSYAGMLCPVATYNVGGNTAGCQNCGPGLTTATNGSTSAAACSECGIPCCCSCVTCQAVLWTRFLCCYCHQWLNVCCCLFL
jgi:hypothetical protein